MDDLRRRLIGYGLGSAIIGTLCWAGFVREAEADLGTLMGAAGVHLELAAGMPPRDREGKPTAAREQLLDQAEGFLARAAVAYPHHAQAHEYRAYLLHLRGDHAGAAASYAAAAAEVASGPVRDELVLNQVRMLHRSGQATAALALAEAYVASCGKEQRAALAIEKQAIEATLESQARVARNGTQPEPRASAQPAAEAGADRASAAASSHPSASPR